MDETTAEVELLAVFGLNLKGEVFDLDFSVVVVFLYRVLAWLLFEYKTSNVVIMVYISDYLVLLNIDYLQNMKITDHDNVLY